MILEKVNIKRLKKASFKEFHIIALCKFQIFKKAMAVLTKLEDPVVLEGEKLIGA